jgi:hypothetical protein
MGIMTEVFIQTYKKAVVNNQIHLRLASANVQNKTEDSVPATIRKKPYHLRKPHYHCEPVTKPIKRADHTTKKMQYHCEPALSAVY